MSVGCLPYVSGPRSPGHQIGVGSPHELYGEHQESEGDDRDENEFRYHQNRGFEVIGSVQVPGNPYCEYRNDEARDGTQRRGNGIHYGSFSLFKGIDENIHLHMFFSAENPCDGEIAQKDKCAYDLFDAKWYPNAILLITPALRPLQIR